MLAKVGAYDPGPVRLDLISIHRALVVLYLTCPKEAPMAQLSGSDS